MKTENCFENYPKATVISSISLIKMTDKYFFIFFKEKKSSFMNQNSDFELSIIQFIAFLSSKLNYLTLNYSI